MKKTKEKSVKDLELIISQLDQKLEHFRNSRNKYDKESRDWSAKRDYLHEEIKKTRIEIRDLIQKRDKLNKEIKILKDIRKKEFNSLSEKTDNLKSIQKQIEIKSDNKNQIKTLEEKIAKADWKIQTGVITFEEEKKIVKYIISLKKQLEYHRNIESKIKQINQLKQERAKNREMIKSIKEKMSDKVTESQEYHEEAMFNIEKVTKLGIEADNLHTRFLESYNQAQSSHKKYVEIIEKIKNLGEIIRKREHKNKEQLEKDLINDLERNIVKKMKNGKKMTFAELKILAEKGKIWTSQD